MGVACWVIGATPSSIRNWCDPLKVDALGSWAVYLESFKKHSKDKNSNANDKNKQDIVLSYKVHDYMKN